MAGQNFHEKQRGEKRSHYVVVAKAAEDLGLQKLVSRLNKCPDKNDDYFKIYVKVRDVRFCNPFC